MPAAHLEAPVVALESDEGAVLASWEQQQGGEALHIQLLVLILSAVHLHGEPGSSQGLL